MAGRWNDERDWRDRERQQRYDDRYDVFGLNDEGDRYAGREERSFDRGERADDRRRGGSDWQDENYGGVSPAMRRGDYETGYRSNPRFRSQDYTRGGRDYGREYNYGAGSGPYGGEGRRFAGYDYDRGHGDAGRDRQRDFEDRAHDSGDFLRRTGRKISNWFGEGRDDDDRHRSGAFRGARGRGPKGYQRSDERISEEVHQRLTDDLWLDATEISCTVSGGEVTLSGTVESREAKHRAERIVEDLSGVKHVQNNLRIQPGSYFTSAGRGYGDSVQDAQMRSDPLKDVTDGSAQQADSNRTPGRRN